MNLLGRLQLLVGHLGKLLAFAAEFLAELLGGLGELAGGVLGLLARLGGSRPGCLPGLLLGGLELARRLLHRLGGLA